MKTITLDEAGMTIVQDLDGRILARITVDEVGPNWQAEVMIREDDTGHRSRIHTYLITAPY